MKVFCNQCNKFLFSTLLTHKGSIGVEAQNHGFVYKNASLFSQKYSSLYFCNKECCKIFYNKNIPKNDNVSNAIKKLKDEIPEMAKECCKGLDRIQSLMKKNKKW